MFKKNQSALYLIVGFCTGAILMAATPALADSLYILSNDLSPTPAPSLVQMASLSTPTSAQESPYRQPIQPEVQPQSVDDMATLRFSLFNDVSPSNSIVGGSSYGLDTTLYSGTIDQHWKIFAGQAYSHELEPIGEGHINYERTVSGVEYHDNLQTTSLAPTYNRFNDQERVGAVGDTSWNLNDNWVIGGNAQLFSRDIPLRALNQGVTANAYNLNASWFPNDRRTLRIDADAMAFSDDNLRTSVTGAYTEHLYVGRRFSFDGLVNVVESQDSKANKSLYYDPSQDALSTIGGRVTQPLYDAHGLTYEHSLEIKPGTYWQEGYGVSPAVSAHYEQRIRSGNNFDIGAGATFTRQSYSGTAQNDEMVLLDLTKRF